MRICQDCNNEISRGKAKRCHPCYSLSRKGIIFTKEHKEKLRIARAKQVMKPTQGFQKGHGLMGNNPTSKGHNWKLNNETKKKQALAAVFRWKEQPDLYKKVCTKNLPVSTKGELHGRWVSDRTKLKKSDRPGLRDSAYSYFRKQVCERDGWKCKIDNKDCDGRLEVHHILPWRSHKELRYDVNNGITLCHFHHPYKKEEESNLSPYFQELVNNNKSK